MKGQVVAFMGKGRSKRQNRGGRRRPDSRSVQPFRATKPYNPDHLKIVVVDDDPVVRRAISRGFGEAGHEVYQHIAGATALPRILRKRPDAVVVDLVMSEMDGLALCREIRRHPELAETVVVIVSGMEDDYWTSRALEDGAAALTLKPMDRAGIAEIENIVRTAKQSTTQATAA